MDRAGIQVPSTAYSFSIAAGVMILTGGVFSVTVRVLFPFTGRFSMMEMVTGLPGLSGVLALALGVVVLWSAFMLAHKPENHEYWGTLILIFSVLSIFGGWGGFGIGLLLGISGGALAIGWRPGQVAPTVPVAPSETPSPGVAPSLRACLQCGRLIPVDVEFCPHCGKQQPL